MRQLIHPQQKARYLLLGPAFETNNLWLARDQSHQRLVLLQRFAHSSAGLHQLLALRHECLPRVLDSWVSQDATYLVLDRVNGLDIDLARTVILRSDTKVCLKNFLSVLARLGWRVPSASALCLDAQGKLRLRWFPSNLTEKAPKVA